jgi:hypothetical protein
MFVTEFHHTETIQLDTAATDLFELLIDVDRLPEWNAHVHQVLERPDGPLENGVEWVIEMHAMGRKWHSRSRAITVDRVGLRFEHRSFTDDGNPSYAMWSWQVTPVGEGSALTVTFTGNPRTFWRRLLLARIRRTGLAEEVRASLAGLDSYLSSQKAAPESA